MGLGFCNFVGPIFATAGAIGVTVGSVFDLNSFVQYGEADLFDFCKDGVVKDDRIVETGEIVVPFALELSDPQDTISAHLGTGAQGLSVRTVFRNGCPDIVGLFDTYLTSVAMSVGSDGYSSDYRVLETGRNVEGSLTCASTFALDSEIDLRRDKAFFRVKYAFAFPTMEAFESEVYGKLNRGKFWFNFKAEIQP